MAAPPPDAPPPDEQSVVSADASFEPSEGGVSLCGFKLPGFNFSFGLNIALPAFPPTFSFAFGLKCDLSNPIDASVEFGGGRVGTTDPDPFEADT